MTHRSSISSSLPAGVSVVICCYNSAQKLPATLQHLAAQQVPDGLPWELVLVNNASTDDTPDVAADTWQQLGSPVPLRIIHEPKPGTDHARRAGVFAAQYSVILFCDDDNWLAPNYLYTGWQFLESHAEVGLVGGQAEAVADVPLPDWFYSMSPYYAACAPAPHSKDLTHFGIWSAGMMGRTEAIRRSLPAHIPLLNAGRVGSNTGFGEDGEICMRVALQGYRIWYLDALRMQHWMEPRRLTHAYRESLLNGVTRPAEVMLAYFRLQRFIRLSGIKKKIFNLWQLLKQHFGNETHRRFSQDYCYYATGNFLYANEYNKVVKEYFEFTQKDDFDKLKYGISGRMDTSVHSTQETSFNLH